MISKTDDRSAPSLGEQRPPQTERLIRDTDGAEILGCSKATFWRLVGKGDIPQPIKIGGMSRWKVSDVQALIARASEARNR